MGCTNSGEPARPMTVGRACCLCVIELGLISTEVKDPEMMHLGMMQTASLMILCTEWSVIERRRLSAVGDKCCDKQVFWEAELLTSQNQGHGP